MKKVWYDLDERERDIICNALDKYCVPYKTIKHETENWFNKNVTWDIETDLSVEEKNGISPYDFVEEKVQEYIDLEDFYNMKSYTKPHTKDEIARDKLRHQHIQKNKDEQLLKDLEATDKMQENNMLSGFWQNMINKLFPKNEEDKVDKKIAEMFGAENRVGDIEDVLINGLMNTVLPAITGKNMGKRVKFEDLPMDMQQDLKQKYPLKLLKSDACHIYHNGNDYHVVLMRAE